MRKPALVLVLVALWACEPEKHTVGLTLGEDGIGARGFECVQDEDPSKLLVARAAGNPVSVVFDFVDLGDTPPGARLGQLLRFCEEEPCLVEQRRCIDLEVPEGGIDLEEAIIGCQVTEDAPDGWVLVRAIGVAVSCADIAAADGESALRDLLLGCVYSSPVVLDDLEGDVVLDLDSFTDRCEQAVEVCASRLMGDASGVELEVLTGCGGAAADR